MMLIGVVCSQVECFDAHDGLAATKTFVHNATLAQHLLQSSDSIGHYMLVYSVALL